MKDPQHQEGLQVVLAMSGWRGWILDGEDRVLGGLGAHHASVQVGATLDQVLDDAADAARILLAELEARGCAEPRPLAWDVGREIMAFRHTTGRVIALRGRPGLDGSAETPDRIGVLLQAMEGLGGAATEDDVLGHLAEVAGEDLGDAAGVWKLSGAHLVLRSGFGLRDRLPLEIEPGDSVVWEVLKARAPLVTGDVGSDPRFQSHPADQLIQKSGARALALLPLQIAGRHLGVLVVAWEKRGLPTRGLLRTLRQLASIAAVALDRAAAADGLASEHRLLEAVLDAVSDGVLGLDGSRRVIFGNLRAQRILGMSEEEMTSQGWADRVFPDADQRDAALQSIFAREASHSAEPIEVTLEQEGRPLRLIQVTSTPTMGPGGDPLVLVFLRDVTEGRRIRARAMAEQNYTRLGRLAGGIAHDFNNLLGAILGHADLIQHSPGAGDQVISRAATIADAAVRGARLSNRLLAFSGSGTIRPQQVDLGPEIERTVRLFRSTLPDRVTLTTRLSRTLGPALADPGQFYQALVNLLANAREAVGEEGEIRVWVKQGAPPESPTWEAPDFDRSRSYVRVAVEDTGPGFTAEALSHLFEPFFTTKKEGHGLGLSAIQGIVSAHEGALHVQNEDGRTRVELYLPAAVSESAVEDSVAEDSPRKQVIWVVDDEAVLLEFIELALKAYGYQVVCFGDPQECLQAARSDTEPPDLLVLDVIMPGQTGPQLLGALREQASFASLPVVWSSGYSPDNVDLGPSDDEVVFLQKPYTGRDLAATIEALLVVE